MQSNTVITTSVYSTPRICQMYCTVVPIDSSLLTVPGYNTRLQGRKIFSPLHDGIDDFEFHCMSVQYDKYIYYNQHYAHDWSGIKSHYLKPLKTTYYLLHVSIPIGSSSERTVPYQRSYCVGLLTGKMIWQHAIVVQVMLVSLGLCLPSATTSDVTLFGTVLLV